VSAAWFVLTRLARDRSALIGLVLIALLVLSAVLAPVLATHPDDVFTAPAERLQSAQRGHWLGTDRMGATSTAACSSGPASRS
jgi:peptide/nickel transport system permease protein